MLSQQKKGKPKGFNKTKGFSVLYFSYVKVHCNLAFGMYKALTHHLGNTHGLSQHIEKTKLTIQTSKSCRTLWFMPITEIIELFCLKVV